MRATLEARLARYETMLAAAYDEMDSLTENAIFSYRLDTGEGSQQVQQRKAEDQQNQIMWLEAQITRINQRLNGTGIVTFTTKRRF